MNSDPRAGFEPKSRDRADAPLRWDAPDVEDIIDPAEVLRRCNQNGDLGATMLQLFAESLPAELESLEVAAAANDMAALGRIAHKMRGAAATLAAARLAGAISGLELFLTHGDGGPLDRPVSLTSGTNARSCSASSRRRSGDSPSGAFVAASF